jgi:sugar phosphate isomerase/epimerase
MAGALERGVLLTVHVGCYDAPFKELPSYRMRLEELCRLGFASVGLAVDWDDPPSDQSAEDDTAIAELLRANRAELRLHPDLGKLERRARMAGEELLPYARRQLDPLIDWALRHGVLSICCDSIRADFEATVAVLRLLIDMTAGTQLKVGVENSQRGIINSADKMNEAVERVDDERMGLLVDVGHINTTITNGWIDCDDPGDFLDGLRVPIWDTHIHNNDGRTDGHLTVRDPAGTLDMMTIVEGLHRLGYTGPLNMECAPKEARPRQTELAGRLVEDREYLKALIARVGAP